MTSEAAGAGPSDEKPHPAPGTEAPLAFEPAPPGRSKKRKGGTGADRRGNNAPVAPEQMIRLGEPVERGSERLQRSKRPARLSAEEKAPQISLDDSQLCASSSRGYSSVRSTHGAFQGTWFFEAVAETLGETGAARVGWSTRAAELQAPVGADTAGYGYRSIHGAKVHRGVREEYGAAFREGDVVGCLLHLPPGGRPLEKTADDVVKYKGQLYFTADEVPPEPRPLEGGHVEFFVNGVSQGRAFDGVLEGTYYPTVSLYTHPTQAEPASVRVNLGESPFAHPPPSAEIACRPACDMPNFAPPS